MSKFIERYWPANRFGKNATVEAVSDAMRKEWAEQSGLDQVEGGHEWFVRFLGKTCICMAGGECGLADEEALGLHDWPNLDHNSYWEGQEGRQVLIAQPYRLALDEMRSLVECADRHDLTVGVSARSFYYPGESLLIEIV